LAEGEKHHPYNYRGCTHVKEKMPSRKSQRTPKTTTGRLFSIKLAIPGVPFAAALRGSAKQQQQQPEANQVPVACPPVTRK
jgi:hypothetical protein